jgi:predicted GIY-YIG superfamily endonuclease
METNIYILKLKNNKYYVGKTQDPAKRFFEHLSGSGSTWTQLHEPIEIINILPNEDNFEENNQVKKLMLIHGIDNVRGGSYSQIELSVEQKNTLQTELRSAQDLCINCGSNRHFIKDCPVKINNYKQNNNNNKQNNNNNNNKQNNNNNNNNKQNNNNNKQNNNNNKQNNNNNKQNNNNNNKQNNNNNKQNSCFRCGRQSHMASDCYATIHINGYELSEDDDSDDDIIVCFRCGRQSHMANDCYATIHINGYEISEDDDSDDDIIVCYKCGRQNHYASQCYAKYYKKN